MGTDARADAAALNADAVSGAVRRADHAAAFQQPVRRAYGWAEPRADGRAQRRADASTERRADGEPYGEPDIATDGGAERVANVCAERRAERSAELCTFAGADIATVEPAVEPAHGDPVGRAFGYAYGEPDIATDGGAARRPFACADGRAYFGAVREPVPRADVRACAATDYYPSDADADDVQDLLL